MAKTAAFWPSATRTNGNGRTPPTTPPTHFMLPNSTLRTVWCQNKKDDLMPGADTGFLPGGRAPSDGLALEWY